MDFFEDFQTTVQSDLNVDSNSTLYPLTIIKLALNRAYVKAGGLFRWSELEDAKKTGTITDQEYYDYPNNWQPDSMWKLKIDDEDYDDPLVFKDYLYEKENNFPSGLTKTWTSQWRRFFVYPTPTAIGSNNISLWGQKTVETLTENSDVTIFSYSMPECNEAIILEAGAILKSKGEDLKAKQFKSLEAKEILTIAWNKIRQNQAKYEKTTPFLDVDDFFGKRRVADKIGNF